ncbi:MAG TPA: DNA polymerase III subunit delta [Tenericutes bacterium]|nr:DNA polymerase III subunit delta [Mycoplasmatota bacterium]
MIYLFYGNNQFSIDNEIKKIIKENKIEEIDKVKYDLEQTNISNILDDALTTSLFENKKLIIVENSYIFTGVNSKKEIDHNIDYLNTYLNSPSTDTILIFITNNEKIDERKKITKSIKKNYIIKEFNNNNSNEYIMNYNIDKETFNYLKNYVGNDNYVIENELKKITLYKNDNSKITKEDINKISSKNIDIDLFSFIDKIIMKNKKEALLIYNELKKYNEEPIKLIVMVANQIRIMYQSKELLKRGYTEKNISETLNIHPYRVKLAIEKSYTYDSKILLDYLKKLADMDENIKKGLIDKYSAFELFIITM